MKYIHSDYGREGLYLPHQPTNSTECYNKLVYLREREMNNRDNKPYFIEPKLSKRRERLIKTFWAFRKIEE